MQLTQDISSKLPDIAKSVALPALLGGAGGGALAGYMSSKSRPANETPGARRRRILRNALVGVVLGGTAGAATPVGAKMLGGEMFGSSSKADAPGSALAFGASNALPIGTGAFLGNRWRGAVQKERGTSMGNLVKQLEGSTVNGVHIRNEALLRKVLEGGGRNEVLRELARLEGGPSFQSLLKNHELLGEAGYKGNVLQQLLSKKVPGEFWGDYKQNVNAADEISKYLRGTSTLPGRLGSISPSGLIGKMVATKPGLPDAYTKHVRPSLGQVLSKPRLSKLESGLANFVPNTGRRLAEGYLKHIRPSTSRMVGRTGTPTRAAGLVAAVLTAKYLQDLAMSRN